MNRVHDLLRVLPDTIDIPGDAPAWVRESLDRTPWVVVRRTHASAGTIPVGVRGVTRDQRYPLTINPATVVDHIAPDRLHRRPIHHIELAAFTALAGLRDRLHDTPLRWGPTGSVGFELAAGASCVTPASDLDVAVFTDTLDLPWDTLAAAVHDLPTRVDCSIELPCGAVTLTEYLDSTRQLLLKSPHGPRLVDRDELTA